MELKPTLYFRWTPDDSGDGAFAISYHYDEKRFFSLQQWWEDESGKGEWRDIKINYGLDNEPPVKK